MTKRSLPETIDQKREVIREVIQEQVDRQREYMDEIYLQDCIEPDWDAVNQLILLENNLNSITRLIVPDIEDTAK